MAESNGARSPHDVQRYVDQTADSIQASQKLLGELHNDSSYAFDLVNRMRQGLANARKNLDDAETFLRSIRLNTKP